MLILQRYAGESISIDKDIQIIVLGQFRGAAHGIKASKEIHIVRKKLRDGS